MLFEMSKWDQLEMIVVNENIINLFNILSQMNQISNDTEYETQVFNRMYLPTLENVLKNHKLCEKTKLALM